MRRHSGLYEVSKLLGRRAGLLVAVGGVAMHVAAASAWAQRSGRVPNEDSGMYQWIAAGVLAVLILLPAFVNVKRPR